MPSKTYSLIFKLTILPDPISIYNKRQWVTILGSRTSYGSRWLSAENTQGKSLMTHLWHWTQRRWEERSGFTKTSSAMSTCHGACAHTHLQNWELIWQFVEIKLLSANFALRGKYTGLLIKKIWVQTQKTTVKECMIFQALAGHMALLCEFVQCILFLL